jgi:hypothetical protein
MPPLELEIPTNLPKDGLCGTGARHRTRRIALVTSKGSAEHVAAEPLTIGGRRNQHFCHTAELVLKPLPNAICRRRPQVNTQRGVRGDALGASRSPNEGYAADRSKRTARRNGLTGGRSLHEQRQSAVVRGAGMAN